MGFSDGGLRKEAGKAAVGWVIVAVVNGVCWLLGKGGACIEIGEGGSFLIEAVAFETLIDNITTLCMNIGVQDDSWQNAPVDFSTEMEHVISRG